MVDDRRVSPLLFLALFSLPAIILLYGGEYVRGAWPLALLALAHTVNAATGPCGHMVTMIGRSDLVLLNSVAALGINLALNVVLIPLYGMVGAGVAWAVSIVLWNALRLWQVWRVLGMHPFREWPARVGACLVAFLAAASALRLWVELQSSLAEIALAAAASVTVYGALLVGLRVVDERDSWLPDRLGRLVRMSHP